MGLNVSASDALKKSRYSGPFGDSIEDVISWASKDSRITDVRELAYLLATAKIESGYSLQRWEADYLCGNVGQPYNRVPCNRALNYYRSTNGKKDYYTLGVDPNGLPYFGRGLIQLTGKGNYAAYGERLGLNLVNNPDLAIKRKNSYDIAVEYMRHRGTFSKVKSGDLYEARKTVGPTGGSWREIADAYNTWVSVLKASPKRGLFATISQRNTPKGEGVNKAALGISLMAVGFLVGITILVAKKHNR